MNGGHSAAFASFMYPGRLGALCFSFISFCDRVGRTFFGAKTKHFLMEIHPAIQRLNPNACPWNKSILKFKCELPSILPLAAGLKAGTITSTETELSVKRDKYEQIHRESDGAQTPSCPSTSNRLEPLAWAELLNWIAEASFFHDSYYTTFPLYEKLTCRVLSSVMISCKKTLLVQFLTAEEEFCTFMDYVLSELRCVSSVEAKRPRVRGLAPKHDTSVRRYLQHKQKSDFVKG